jgi:transposase
MKTRKSLSERLFEARENMNWIRLNITDPQIRSAAEDTFRTIQRYVLVIRPHRPIDQRLERLLGRSFRLMKAFRKAEEMRQKLERQKLALIKEHGDAAVQYLRRLGVDVPDSKSQS